jgi:hypothetical protein
MFPGILVEQVPQTGERVNSGKQMAGNRSLSFKGLREGKVGGEFSCSQVPGSAATLEQVEAVVGGAAERSRKKVCFQVHREELLDVRLEVACSLGSCQDDIPQI